MLLKVHRSQIQRTHATKCVEVLDQEQETTSLPFASRNYCRKWDCSGISIWRLSVPVVSIWRLYNETTLANENNCCIFCSCLQPQWFPEQYIITKHKVKIETRIRWKWTRKKTKLGRIILCWSEWGKHCFAAFARIKLGKPRNASELFIGLGDTVSQNEWPLRSLDDSVRVSGGSWIGRRGHVQGLTLPHSTPHHPTIPHCTPPPHPTAPYPMASHPTRWYISYSTPPTHRLAPSMIPHCTPPHPLHPTSPHSIHLIAWLLEKATFFGPFIKNREDAFFVKTWIRPPPGSENKVWKLELAPRSQTWDFQASTSGSASGGVW